MKNKDNNCHWFDGSEEIFALFRNCGIKLIKWNAEKNHLIIKSNNGILRKIPLAQGETPFNLFQDFKDE